MWRVTVSARAEDQAVSDVAGSVGALAFYRKTGRSAQAVDRVADGHVPVAVHVTRRHVIDVRSIAELAGALETCRRPQHLHPVRDGDGLP
jgi:hypothetical protein